MTSTPISKPRSLTTALAIGGVLAVTALLLVASGEASRAALRGILLCGTDLIPSLFPFLVFSSLLLRLGLPQWLGKRLGRPLGRWLGLPPTCVAAVLVGVFGGFPAGAVAVHAIRQDGLCDRTAGERAVWLSSLAGPGFVIAGVGGLLPGGVRTGVVLFGCQLLAMLILARLPLGGPRHEGIASLSFIERPPVPLLSALASALREATDAMLGICGAVIFFSTLVGFVSLLPLPPLGLVLISCLLEVTSGTALAAELLPPTVSLPIMAFAIGWAGISVHAQTVIAVDGELSLNVYLLRKLATGLLTAVLGTAALLVGLCGAA